MISLLWCLRTVAYGVCLCSGLVWPFASSLLSTIPASSVLTCSFFIGFVALPGFKAGSDFLPVCATGLLAGHLLCLSEVFALDDSTGPISMMLYDEEDTHSVWRSMRSVSQAAAIMWLASIATERRMCTRRRHWPGMERRSWSPEVSLDLWSGQMSCNVMGGVTTRGVPAPR